MSNAFKEITSELIVAAENLAARGLTIEQIAHSIGFGRTTLYDKIKENKELSDAIKRGKSKGIATIANALFESAKKGNITAQIFYLKCQAKWREEDLKELDNSLDKAKADVLEIKKKEANERIASVAG